MWKETADKTTFECTVVNDLEQECKITVINRPIDDIAKIVDRGNKYNASKNA